MQISNLGRVLDLWGKGESLNAKGVSAKHIWPALWNQIADPALLLNIKSSSKIEILSRAFRGVIKFYLEERCEVSLKAVKIEMSSKNTSVSVEAVCLGAVSYS